jgi:hypothetical protein
MGVALVIGATMIAARAAASEYIVVSRTHRHLTGPNTVLYWTLGLKLCDSHEKTMLLTAFWWRAGIFRSTLVSTG